jgi:hypothetical protein
MRRALVAVVFTLITIGLTAQQKSRSPEFEPHVGQAGKDVIWVPTPDALVQKMLEIAKVTPEDVLVDLGSGDGRTVIAAAKKNARATGVEFNEDMVNLSRKNAEQAGVSGRAKFVKGDLFDYDLSQATVITMFLLPDINLKLRPKLLDLKPGTRIVSNTFTMGDWKPDVEAEVQANSSWNTALLWIVPAKVEGNWSTSPGEMMLKQTYQNFSGNIKQGNKVIPVTEGKLEGNKISFKAGDSIYSGTVNINYIEGTVSNGSSTKNWSATKL